MRILNLSRAKLRVSLLVLFAGLAALAPLQPTATFAGAPPQTIKGSIHYTWRGAGVVRLADGFQEVGFFLSRVRSAGCYRQRPFFRCRFSLVISASTS